MKFKINTNEMTARMEIAPITKVFVNKISPESKTTIASAMRLFKKCAKIGTKILSVFKYRIAIQTPNMKAEKMLPNPCRDAKISDEINIANVVGTISFNLFRKTPLKISSSEIGEMIIVARKLNGRNVLNALNEFTPFKMKSQKYNIPYEINMFKQTITRTDFRISFENRLEISPVIEKSSVLSLKIK